MENRTMIVLAYYDKIEAWGLHRATKANPEPGPIFDRTEPGLSINSGLEKAMWKAREVLEEEGGSIYIKDPRNPGMYYRPVFVLKKGVATPDTIA